MLRNKTIQNQHLYDCPHFIKLPTIEEIFGLKKPVPIIVVIPK
jgi:hypothetical protein